jgi:hypothetical protein
VLSGERDPIRPPPKGEPDKVDGGEDGDEEGGVAKDAVAAEDASVAEDACDEGAAEREHGARDGGGGARGGVH